MNVVVCGGTHLEAFIKEAAEFYKKLCEESNYCNRVYTYSFDDTSESKLSKSIDLFEMINDADLIVFVTDGFYIKNAEDGVLSAIIELFVKESGIDELAFVAYINRKKATCDKIPIVYWVK